jgi:hypothetical protein
VHTHPISVAGGTRKLRRRRAAPHTGPADHLTLPLEQELSRAFCQEHYLVLTTLDEPLAQAIQAMRSEVYDITSKHCDTIVAAFHTLQQAVHTCISVFDGPDLSAVVRPYQLIVKLSALYRVLAEAQVLVRSVRGQCLCGCLATDPTGAYWHLRQYLRTVVADYRSLLDLLGSKQTTVWRYTSATA